MSLTTLAENLKTMTRREAINTLSKIQRYQLTQLRRELGIKTCSCKTDAELIIKIVAHLHPQKQALGGNTIEQKSLL